MAANWHQVGCTIGQSITHRCGTLERPRLRFHRLAGFVRNARREDIPVAESGMHDRKVLFVRCQVSCGALG